ncbi:uncharacterized protein LOC141538064 [Cotesia typhae]|uniref:uncharacterized protein LOC141538064 n=1 Tax=Cotesia typhae TaxID=2053667 RepID=UPI003D680705
MMTLALGAEESLTWKTIIAILSMINTLFQNDVVPASKYKLFKTLKLNEDILVYHIYCKECNNYIGAQKKLNKDEFQCKICDKNGKSSDIAYFLTFDISLQLKSILEDPEVQQFLMENRQDKRDDCNNSDLQNMRDGKIYKKSSTINNPLSEEYNFSYTFNTDGCQPSKSSKLSIWPIYARINEFSSKLQSKHMIMTDLWIDEKEPDMLLFLQPFIDEANKLSEKGVQWKLLQQTITSKFIPICAVVDSVARCKILNMKQYNGSYGCTFCEHRTERINNSQKYTVSMIVPRQRTDELIKEEMLLAGGNKYGVGKQHTDIVLSSFGEDYYVGNPNEVESINTKLLNFKHPTCITRSPRKVTEREMWKATEWRSWLLFYSLICLKGILPQKYLEHLALLVEALRILLSDRISHDELDTADSLILRYVVTYQEYFGKQAMTYNVHLLLHIVKSVKNLGPLWCHNTFIFENENHFLLKLQKSPNHITIQIARRYLFQKALSPLKNKINISQNFLQFCEKNLTGRLKNTFDVDGCILVGNGKKYNLNDNERKIIHRFDKCKSFNRFIYNSKRYTSKNYRSCEKIDDSVILLKNGKIGIIQNVCYFNFDKTEEKIYIFYHKVIKLKKYFHSSRTVTVHNIEECLITENLQFCEVNMILQPCMLTSVQNKHYAIFIPHGCYGD